MLFTNDKTSREYESPILIRRDELGIKMIGLCRLCECTPPVLYDLAYGKTWPVYLTSRTVGGIKYAAYDVKPLVTRLGAVLGMDIEDMFPLYFCKIRGHQDVNPELFTGRWSMRSCLPHDDIYAAREVVFWGWDTLSTREKKAVVDFVIYEKTYDEIGKDFTVSGERVRELVVKALRKLRCATYRVLGGKDIKDELDD